MNMLRALTVLVMVVIPGALLAVTAFLLARAVSEGMARQVGPGHQRFARALVAVRVKDVWSHARRTLG